ncbi:MAG: tetratricopeptide repeat protein [Okeania sp. SIO3C4]|nr:tetratricopeptide repeat protein [Okeania sp. SIO3C4]
MQPDNSRSALKKGRHWQREGKLAEAEAAYRQATEANPSFFPTFQCLGEVLQLQGKLDEAISAYEQVKKLNSKTLWANQRLGEIFLQQNKLDEAIAYFQSAIEINPNFSFAYNSLGECWSLQGKEKEAIAAYQKAVELNPDSKVFSQNLEKVLAQQNQVDKTPDSCPETRQQEPSLGKACEYIWKGLNQLEQLDETSAYSQAEIQWNVAEAYFIENSQYQLVRIDSLAESDKTLLEKSGFSISHLEQIFLDDLNLEESYINSFNQDRKIHLARKVEKKLWERWKYPDTTQGLNFQQSMVETGYIYSICPVSGTVLRSNQSFTLDWDSHFYRFAGVHVFYLMVGGWGGSKRFVYFPHLELVLGRINDLVRRGNNYQQFINTFKSYVVSCCSSFKYYIDNAKPKETVALCGYTTNLGHFFWNDMSGIQNLWENDILHKIDKFLVGPHEYFSIAHIFPEIPPEKFVHTTETGIALFQSLMSSNYFCVRVTDLVVKKKLATRVKQAALQRCSPVFLQEIELAKRHFPILWVGCRYRNRVWLSQVEGTANIIKSLYSEFPNLAVVFGGWSPKESEEATPDEASKLETPIKTFVEQVLELIPSYVQTYKAFSRPNYENVIFCNAIDLFICTVGAETAYLSLIANKPGVIHANTGFPNSVTEPLYVEARENCIPPILIGEKYIVEQDKSHHLTRNYDCDSQVIYNEVIKLTRDLILSKTQDHKR